MGKRALKYTAALLAAVLAMQMVFGAGLRSGSQTPRTGLFGALRDSVATPGADDAGAPAGVPTAKDTLRPTASGCRLAFHTD